MVRKLDNHRRMKNIGVYILADYRLRNKKPSINEILQDVIQKDKEKRKAQKLKLMQLMKFDDKKENKDDVEVLSKEQVQSIIDTVVSVEKQVEFQRQLVTSLQKKLWVALDGKESISNLKKLQTRARTARKSIASSLLPGRDSRDELQEEIENIGKDYLQSPLKGGSSKPTPTQKQQAPSPSANPWDNLPDPVKPQGAQPRAAGPQPERKLDPRNAQQEANKEKN